MTKLPVGSTALDAVKFGFKNMATTIRLGWVGLLVSIIFGAVAVGFFAAAVGWESFEVLEQLDSGDFQDEMEALHAVLELYAGIWLVVLFAGLAFVPLYVILTKMAAGVADSPGGIGYFRFGGTELKYVVGAIMIFVLHLIVAALASLPAFYSFGFAISGGFANTDLNTTGHDPAAIENMVESSAFGIGGALGVLFIVLAVVAIIWFTVRVITFLPSIAADDRLDLGRAMKMTRGNVWHIIGAVILFWLLLYAIEIAVSIGAVIIFLIFAFLFQAAGAAVEGLGLVVIILGGLVGFFVFLFYLMFNIAAGIALPANIYRNLKANVD